MIFFEFLGGNPVVRFWRLRKFDEFFFQERNVSSRIDAGQGGDLFVGFSLGVSVVKMMCFNILAAKIEIVSFFLDSVEICSLLLELCMGVENFECF